MRRIGKGHERNMLKRFKGKNYYEEPQWENKGFRIFYNRILDLVFSKNQKIKKLNFFQGMRTFFKIWRTKKFTVTKKFSPWI